MKPRHDPTVANMLPGAVVQINVIEMNGMGAVQQHSAWTFLNPDAVKLLHK